MSTRATAADERPLFLRAGDDDIFAVHTQPAGPARAEGVILLQGGSWIPSPGRNRLWVVLARTLAGQGHHVIRLDYRGVGESGGHIDNYSLAEPFVEEVLAAGAVLRAAGCASLVLLGTCFGARTAMAAAPQLAEVRALALFPAPTREFEMGHRMASLPTSGLARRALRVRALRGLADPTRRRAYLGLAHKKLRRGLARARGHTDRAERRFEWASAAFVRQLEGTVAAGAAVLFVYGEDDDYYRDFRQGLRGRLGPVLATAGEAVQVEIVPGKLHGLTTVVAQTAASEVLLRWFTAEFRV